MAASSEHQGLQIAVIIFALLTIIMSGATFYVFKLSEDAELRAAAASKENQDATNALKAEILVSEELRKMMGTKFNQPNMKLEDVQTLFKADMQKYASTMVPEKQAYFDALEDARNAQIKGAEDTVKLLDRVNKMAADLDAKTKEKDEMIAKHRDEAASAQTQLKDAGVKFGEDRKKLNDDKQTLAKDLQELRTSMETQIAQAQAAVKKLTDEKGLLVNLKDGIQTKLDEIQKKTFVSADGEIRWVSPQTKTVWVNLGREDGLKKNVTFSVYGLDQNGVARSDSKGSIEVTQILGAHLAEARILEDNLSDPILIRDQLYTPLWHPGRTEQFAVCGLIDLDKDGVSDVSFIKDLILRNGGEWVAELLPDGSVSTQGEGMTINTRYLIQGQPFPGGETAYSELLGAAKQLGVEVINIEKFLDYVGWKETAKVVNFGRDSKPEDFLYDPNQDRPRRPAASSAGANNFRRREPPRASGPSAYSAPR